MSNLTKNYVSSPTPIEYKTANSEALGSLLGISKSNKRLLSARDKSISPSSSDSFKYFETTLMSSKEVTFNAGDPSMLDTDFASFLKTKAKRKYNVIRFDRKHNIKSFDFTLTYTQLAEWGAKNQIATPITRAFLGSILFTGCSNVKNTETYEDLPLEAHVRFESIGDGVGTEGAVDGFGDNMGGPSFTFTYSFTSKYIYLFVSAITPFRLIPKADGTFVDLSYAEGRGQYVGETREKNAVNLNKETGATQYVGFTANADVHFDLEMSIRDNSISSVDSNFTAVDISSKDFTDDEAVIATNAKTFTIHPTRGEICTYGMMPASDVDLEVATDVVPIKYTSRLFKSDMPAVHAFIEKLEDVIKRSSTTVDTIPFVIKSVIRTKGKYNVRGDYFIDSQADSFGSILITEAGIYDAKKDEFKITTRVFDKTTAAGNETVGALKEHLGSNVSEYLKSITEDNPSIHHTSTSDKILSLIRNISFETPDNLSVYSEVSFIRSSSDFECVKAFLELGSENGGHDDSVIYFNADNSIRVCSFKDYDMVEPVIVYPLDAITDIAANSSLKPVVKIKDVARVFDEENSRFVYFITTNCGLIFKGYFDYDAGKFVGEFIRAFDDKEIPIATNEIVSVVHRDTDYIVFTGNAGNVSLFDVKESKFVYLPKRFNPDEKVCAISYTRTPIEDTINGIVFATNKRTACYSLTGGWDYSHLCGENVFAHAKLGINDNTDLIACVDGYENVPSVQAGPYRYYLGVRRDTAGEIPVYCRIELKTGKVDECAVPDFKMFNAKLAYDGDRYIVAIGGAPTSTVTLETPDDIKDYVAIYDTIADTWLDIENNEFVLENNSYESDSVKRKLSDLQPVFVDGNTVYIMRPEVKFFTHNATTNVFELNTAVDNCGYKLVISNEGVTVEKIDCNIEFLNNRNVQLYPVGKENGAIYFAYGAKVTETVTEVVNNTNVSTIIFKAYRIGLVGFNLSDETVEVIGSVDLTHPYFDELYSSEYVSAIDDLFDRAAIAVGKRAFVVYALNGMLVVKHSLGSTADNWGGTEDDVLLKSVTFTPLYHETGSDVKLEGAVTKIKNERLLEANEYDVLWNRFGRSTENVTMSFVDESHVVILGGNALRLPIVMDISSDKPYINRVPSTVPRIEGEPDTAVLNGNNYGDYIRVVSTPGLVCDSISLVEVGNHVFALNKIKDYLKPSIYYLNKSDDSYFRWMRDCTTSGNTATKFYSNYKGFAVGAFAVFIPETVKNKVDDIWFESPSYSEDYVAPTYNCDPALRSFASFTFLAGKKKRVILTNELYPNKAIFICENDNSAKATAYCITATGVGLDVREFTTAKLSGISTLNKEWEVRPESILTGGSYGKYSFIVASTGIVRVDFTAILNGEEYIDMEFSNLFEDGLPNKAVCQDTEYLYVSGGKSLSNDVNNEFYKISKYKLAIADNGRIETQHSVLNVSTNASRCPIYTTGDSVCVYGKEVYSVDNSVIRTRATIYSCLKSDMKYAPKRAVFDIGKITSSEYNRYNPKLHAMSIDGHEVLLAFGGRQGTSTEITTSVELFDVERRRWVSIPALPTKLQNINFIGNKIVFATKLNEDDTLSAYLHILTLKCNDFDTYDFEWDDEAIADSQPVASSCVSNVSADGKKYLAIGVDTDGNLLNSESSMKIYTAGENGFDATVLPTIVLNSQLSYHVLAAYFGSDGNVRVALYDESGASGSTIVIWKYTELTGWTSISAGSGVSGLEDFATYFGRRISTLKSISGLFGIAVKDCYVYTFGVKIKLVGFADDAIYVKEIFDTRPNYNAAGIEDETDFTEFTFDERGWIFTFDNTSNEFVAISPALNGYKTSTIKRDDSTVISVSGSTNLVCKLVVNDDDNTLAVDYDSIDGHFSPNLLEPVIDSNGNPVQYDENKKYRLYEDKYLIESTKAGALIRDIERNTSDSTREFDYATIMDIENFEFDELPEINICNGKLSIVGINDGKVRSIIIAFTFDYIHADTLDYVAASGKLPLAVYFSDAKQAYLFCETNRLHLEVRSHGKLFAENDYLTKFSPKVLGCDNRDNFYLYDEDGTDSSVYSINIDINDKYNQLYYRNILHTGVKLSTLPDVSIVDGVAISLKRGLTIVLDGSGFDTSYLRNDYFEEGYGRVVESDDLILHLTKDGANSYIKVYDTTLAGKTVKSFILSKAADDELDTELTVPFDAPVVFTAVTPDDKSMHLILIKDDILYNINTVNGNVARADISSWGLPNLAFAKTYKDPRGFGTYILTKDSKYIYAAWNGEHLEYMPADLSISHLDTIEDVESYNAFKDEIVVTDNNGRRECIRRGEACGIEYCDKPIFDGIPGLSILKSAVPKFERFGEFLDGTELWAKKTENFMIYVYPTKVEVIHNQSGATKIVNLTGEATDICWIVEANGILLIGQGSSENLTKIHALKYDDEFGFAYRNDFEIDNYLPKCCGVAAGATTARSDATDDGMYREGHIVFANGRLDNTIVEINFEYSSEYETVADAFETMHLRQFEINAFNELSGDVVHKFHLVHSRNNSIIILGDSSSTSRVINFDKTYELPVIVNFNFNRNGRTLYVYQLMDSIHVGTVTDDVSVGTVVNAYEIQVNRDGALASQKLVGQMPLPEILSDKADVVAYNENDRLPTVETVLTYCPVIFFIDTIKPISEINQPFVGADKLRTSSIGSLSKLAPVAVEVADDNTPVVWFSAGIDVDKLVLVGLNVNGRLHVENISTVLDSAKPVLHYGESEMYDNEICPSLVNKYVKDESSIVLHSYNDGNQVFHIKNVDGTVSDIDKDSSDYPFGSGDVLLKQVFVYGENDRSVTFIDTTGNVYTYDRVLKKFMDVNGEIGVDIPYFSSEIKILPCKIDMNKEGINVAKRIWAFSNESPYNSSMYGDEGISKKDDTLLD